ncbi:MAG: hypothetical protein DHS20C03_40080 [Minwuia thermotolerans]|nr:MAG: hypothetical protein DHS20C03_40080 [Minwuia thermotolerans]
MNLTYRNKFGPLHIRIARRIGGSLGRAAYRTLLLFPAFRFLKAYEGKQGPITLPIWFMQKVVGFNRSAYWGVHFTSKVTQPKQIIVGRNTNPGIEPGCYIQGIGTVIIGDYVEIAANTSIISANHDLYDLDRHLHGRVEIGSNCWIGANCVILPDVTLGDFTVVAAGSIVTKPFLEGHCVIAGNPARKIRDLDPERCQPRSEPEPYVGYMPAASFPAYREDHLWA